MKTIEERAEKYGIESVNLLCSDLSEEQRERQAEIYARVYTKIATEQKKIDIDKACDAHCRICDFHSCCPYEFEGCYERNEIRKAMED